MHTSTLPKYRGPIPVNWAIRNGDKAIGVSIHWMESECDDVVPRLLWEEVDRCIERLLLLALSRAETGSAGTPQEEGAPTYAGWMEPEFSWIDWSNTREEIHNQVRAIRFGSSGRSGPVATVADRRVRVLRTPLQSADGIKMMCADGPVWITESIPVADSAS
ncbi:formyltransferase family protein [Streptomyces sp. NPDC001083]|uniref:formyltransferase family protein n=1 Tax=Streptomyces sp. NPDC001083 TaxID=3364545 RepID=UPI00368DBC4E